MPRVCLASDITLRALLFTALLCASIFIVGCWDDGCPDGCDPGYACYYGVCLSRGFCPLGTFDSTNCAQYDGDGACIQEVEHGICDRGFVCVCDDFDPATGQCTGRYCAEDTAGD